MHVRTHFTKMILFCPFLSFIITKIWLIVENSADPDETPRSSGLTLFVKDPKNALAMLLLVCDTVCACELPMQRQ